MLALSSIQPPHLPASRHVKRLLAGLLLAAALLASGRVRAEPCNPDALCPSSPCVVTGSHVYEQGCFFDWTGKDVTIAGGASLFAPGGDLDFLARNLTIDGAVEAKQANSLFWEIEQNFTTRRTSGPGRVIFGSAKYYGLDSTINVGGSATFGGSAFILNGQYVRLNVSASSVAVNGLGGRVVQKRPLLLKDLHRHGDGREGRMKSVLNLPAHHCAHDADHSST